MIRSSRLVTISEDFLLIFCNSFFTDCKLPWFEIILCECCFVSFPNPRICYVLNMQLATKWQIKQALRSGIKFYWRHVNTCSQKLTEPEHFKWYLLLDASQQYFVTCYPGFVFGMIFSNNIMLNCFCEQFLVRNNPFHNCKFHLSAKSSFVILYWRSKIMKSWQS